MITRYFYKEELDIAALSLMIESIHVADGTTLLLKFVEYSLA
jgi:hypothetical protein